MKLKSLIIPVFCMSLLFALTSAEETVSYPKISNSSFKVGEKLRYRVTYGFVDAGEATIEVKSTSRKGNGRDLYHVVGTGKTLGAFNTFYRVRDTYESYIDQKSMMPWYFVRDVNEGGYEINQKYTFKQDDNKVISGDEEYDITMGMQDMISSFYKARTLDFVWMEKGQIFSFKCFMDNEIYDLKIKYVEDEEIKIRKGKFKCHKFVPVVQTGRYFKHEDDVQFWITADKNKIPVLVKAKIPVGTVKLHLVEWSGLKNDLSSKID